MLFLGQKTTKNLKKQARKTKIKDKMARKKSILRTSGAGIE